MENLNLLRRVLESIKDCEEVQKEWYDDPHHHIGRIPDDEYEEYVKDIENTEQTEKAEEAEKVEEYYWKILMIPHDPEPEYTTEDEEEMRRIDEITKQAIQHDDTEQIDILGRDDGENCEYDAEYEEEDYDAYEYRIV